MKRRDFIKSGAAIAAVGAVASNLKAQDSSSAPAREFYELRQYHLRMGPKQKIFEDYFREAAVPALNRAGISPVGVFNVLGGPDSPTAYVLLPCASFEALVAAATDPNFVRVESSFLRAFAGMPKLEAPEAKPRVFELRTYESPTEKTG